MIQVNTLVIGASVSGLASAACLQNKGVEFILIEKEARAAMPWRNHYERLHLHTNKSLSNLPIKKFGSKIPRYPSRQEVVDYLDDYQSALNIRPVFNTGAQEIWAEGGYWITETNRGRFQSKYLVLATGAYGRPRAIHFNGMESFPGRILHSSGYKTGKAFAGEEVLVVGFGNSACEIAIDLYEQGARPSMSVRSPVNVIPRDILGIPILRLSLLLSKLPPRLADAIDAPLMRLLFGDIAKLGLKKLPYGAFEQIQKDGSIPLLDIGTIKHIREGHIRIYNNIHHIEGKTVYFESGDKKDFDTLVAAIGYDRNYPAIRDLAPARIEDLKLRINKQRYFGMDGLYFCGFWVSPTGQIREIASDAAKIAEDIARKEKNSNKTGN